MVKWVCPFLTIFRALKSGKFAEDKALRNLRDCPLKIKIKKSGGLKSKGLWLKRNMVMSTVKIVKIYTII